MTKSALITGITGQDGSYLAEYLLENDYDVYGLDRWSSTDGYERIEHIIDEITLLQGDLSDQASIDRAVRDANPDEVYNLGAISFIPTSFEQPVQTGDVTGLGVTRVLEAIRNYDKDIRFYQASSSELFGNSENPPQSINTPFQPRSPYAIAKLSGYWTTVNYREAYDIFAVNGVLFNHESPRRGDHFVTRKITKAVAKIHLGLQDELQLGNLDAERDWGHARDYVRAMHMMLQQSDPNDYVIGTGEHHSVRECAKVAFDYVGLNWEDYVVVDDELFRPTEVEALRADRSAATENLDWEPETAFEDMIEEMVDSDLARLQPDV